LTSYPAWRPKLKIEATAYREKLSYPRKPDREGSYDLRVSKNEENGDVETQESFAAFKARVALEALKGERRQRATI
jgi:hypothetical protein